MAPNLQSVQAVKFELTFIFVALRVLCFKTVVLDVNSSEVYYVAENQGLRVALKPWI